MLLLAPTVAAAVVLSSAEFRSDHALQGAVPRRHHCWHAQRRVHLIEFALQVDGAMFGLDLDGAGLHGGCRCQQISALELFSLASGGVEPA